MTFLLTSSVKNMWEEVEAVSFKSYYYYYYYYYYY
jgi:hypothetical protein